MKTKRVKTKRVRIKRFCTRCRKPVIVGKQRATWAHVYCRSCEDHFRPW
jgi:hypothetical protein